MKHFNWDCECENCMIMKAGRDLYEALMAVYKDIELQNVKNGSDELNIIVQQALAKVEGK